MKKTKKKITKKKKKTIRVSVTIKDIQCGKAFDRLCCPVALAMKRTLRRKVHVGFGHMFIGGLAIKLSKKVRKFISAFDYGTAAQKSVTVKPFTFSVQYAG